MRSEPKFVVFLSQLLLLFQICPMCKTSNPLVKTRQIGTMVEVKTTCANIHCPSNENVWRSQPEMRGTRMPAGNLLLCFAILVAGGSASKVFRVFKHMGLACLSLRTFFKHQKVRYRSIQQAASIRMAENVRKFRFAKNFLKDKDEWYHGKDVHCFEEYSLQLYSLRCNFRAKLYHSSFLQICGNDLTLN